MTARGMELGQADFSPLGIWLPWLSAPASPKHRMRNMSQCVCACVSTQVCLCLFMNSLSKWFMKHPAYLSTYRESRTERLVHLQRGGFNEKNKSDIISNDLIWYKIVYNYQVINIAGSLDIVC